MEFAGQLMLAYLEEDDTRRVLFRVRPLISQEGAFTPEDLEELEQDGFLRIAPDRQEQHSFKDRMSELGSLCLINLLHAETAMGKVRLNKNYAPGRGDNNRYIIYSDAIQALPSEMVYEVVSEDKRHTALTSQYYLRAGGRISGPHCRQGSITCPASQSLMPDCERLFLVEMPDGTSRMFYWPRSEQLEGLRQAAETASEASETDEDAQADWLAEDADTQEDVPFTPPSYPLFDAARQQVYDALRVSGFDLDEAQAAHLLMACLLFERVGLAGDNLSDAYFAAQTLLELFPSLAVTLGHKSNGSPQHVLSLLVEEGKGKSATSRTPGPSSTLKAARASPNAQGGQDPQHEGAVRLFGGAGQKRRRAGGGTGQPAAVAYQAGSSAALRLRAQIARFYRCGCAFEHQHDCVALIKRYLQPYYRALGLEEEEDAQAQWAY